MKLLNLFERTIRPNFKVVDSKFKVIPYIGKYDCTLCYVNTPKAKITSYGLYLRDLGTKIKKGLYTKAEIGVK